MAELHYIIVLAQRVAEGRKQHPSNTHFGEWADNDPEVLRRNRGGLAARLPKLDPQEASAAIRRSRYSAPERLWYNDLKYLAVRKTPPALPKRKTPTDGPPSIRPVVVLTHVLPDLVVIARDRLQRAAAFIAQLHRLSIHSPHSWRRAESVGRDIDLNGPALELAIRDAEKAGSCRSR